MWELDYKESWAPKNWCFWTVVLEKTLESPLDCKNIQTVRPKGGQSWIFIRGLMLKLNLQYFGHLRWRADSLENTLMLGKIEGRRRRGWQRMRCLIASLTQWTWIWVRSGRQWRTEEPGVLQSMGSQRVGRDLANEQQTQCACLNLFFFLIQPQCNCSIPLPPLCKAAWLKENLSHLGHHEWSLML